MGILDLAKEYFNNGVVDTIAEDTRENPSIVKVAISAILPSILAGVIEKASTEDGAQGLISLLNEHDGEAALAGLSGAPSKFGGYKDLIPYGAKILPFLFGTKTEKVEEVVSAQSGLSKTGVSLLLKMAAPVVIGIISKHFKGSGVGMSGLVSFLMGQKDDVKAALPTGLLSSLNFPELGNYRGKKNVPEETIDQPDHKHGAVKTGLPAWLPWSLAAVILALGILAFKACQEDDVTIVEGTRIEADSLGGKIADVAGDVRAGTEALGDFFAKKIPGGVELSIPESGIENKLITFIEDASTPVDKTTWFNFDRINFETGSAELSAESFEQTKNIAEILKAFPEVTLKIGGYTDNTGDPQFNLKLSQSRADAVKAAIVSEGVQEKRLDTEGYGQEHPVATNDTEDGRSQNRRIAVRVTNK